MPRRTRPLESVTLDDGRFAAQVHDDVRRARRRAKAKAVKARRAAIAAARRDR